MGYAISSRYHLMFCFVRLSFSGAALPWKEIPTSGGASHYYIVDWSWHDWMGFE
jgi:hypothetical protein